MEKVILAIQIGLFCIFMYFGLLKIFLPLEKIEKSELGS